MEQLTNESFENILTIHSEMWSHKGTFFAERNYFFFVIFRKNQIERVNEWTFLSEIKIKKNKNIIFMKFRKRWTKHSAKTKKEI